LTHTAPHVEPSPPETLGAFLRRERRAANVSLETMATSLGYSSTFLSDVERDQRPASRSLCMAMARVMGLDTVELLARAGHLTEDAAEYLRRRPRALYLLDLLARIGADDETLESLRREALRIHPRISDPEAVHGSVGDPRAPTTR